MRFKEKGVYALRSVQWSTFSPTGQSVWAVCQYRWWMGRSFHFFHLKIHQTVLHACSPLCLSSRERYWLSSDCNVFRGKQGRWRNNQCLHQSKGQVCSELWRIKVSPLEQTFMKVVEEPWAACHSLWYRYHLAICVAQWELGLGNQNKKILMLWKQL